MDNIEKIVNTKPSAGFPPLYICKKENKKKFDDDEIKIRGFAKDEEKIVASLKDIMQERKNEKEPFIML